jgi:hypothetical protein
MAEKYKKKSNLINKTGYTPGYDTEKNPVNYIPSENITMANTPYPLKGTPLDENGNPIGKSIIMFPGEDYNFDGASYVEEKPFFQKGGKKTIYVESKNDPRYIAYQDSVKLYNHTLSRFKEPWASDKKFKKTINSNKNSKEYKEALKKYYDEDVKKSNIKPTSIFFSDRKKDTYIPVFKKPEEEVIVQRPQEQIIQNLQPIGIQNDFNIEASLPKIIPYARIPRYYDVQDVVHGAMGDSTTDYKWYPANGEPLQQIAPEPYNTRTMVPRYQKGGKKIYVESKNDPRYIAYQDSASAYNKSIIRKNKTLKNIKEILDEKDWLDKLISGGKDDIIKVKTKESFDKYPGGIKPIASYHFQTPNDLSSEFVSELFGGNSKTYYN